MIRDAGLISLADQRVHDRLGAMIERTGGIAHDLNNMLGTMLCYACLLLEDAAADDPSRPALEKIVEAGLEAKQLVAALSYEPRESSVSPSARAA